MICFGTRSGDLSEWLMLSAIPEKLRATDPNSNSRYFRRSFGSAVFQGNSAVRGSAFFPKGLLDLKEGTGSGHPIQRLERRLMLPISEKPKPSLHVSESERGWAKRFLASHELPGNSGKPIIVVHPWGEPKNPVAPVDFWDKLLAKWSHRFRFWQLGLIGQGAVVGCEYYYWIDGAPHSFRKAFAIAEQAQGFIGTPTAAMHIAAAFGVPSFITLRPEESALPSVYPQAARVTLHPSFHGDVPASEQSALDSFFGALT